MKKNEYMTPEMEVIKMQYHNMLMASGENPQPGGEIPGEGPNE